MAVIDELPGLQATIQVDGHDLQEYDLPHLEEAGNQMQSIPATNNGNAAVSSNVKYTHVVKKYIEAMPGAEFRFNFVKSPSFKHNGHHLAITLKVDNDFTSPTHELAGLQGGQWKSNIGTLRSQDPNTGNIIDQQMSFGIVNIDCTGAHTTETIQKGMGIAKGLGVLGVSVFEMQFTQETRQIVAGKRSPATEETKIPEQAIKGRNLTSAVQFGKAEEARPAPLTPVDVFLDPEKRPLATFEFIYLTKEGLIKEGILPEPLPIDDMDNDELRRWAREQFLKERDRLIKDEKPSVDIKEKEYQEPCGNRKRGPGHAEVPALKRYKEDRREDGKVEIDLTD